MSSSACMSLCESWKEKLSYRSKRVEFLLDNLTENGCPFNYSTLIRCKECKKGSGMAGGFALNMKRGGKGRVLDPQANKNPEDFGGARDGGVDPHVVVCANEVRDYAEFESTVGHELIHAIDQCRVRNPDWRDVRKHACTEIRASSLSGECDVGVEVMRGNFKSKGGQIECVKRRAKLSVMGNPNLKKGMEGKVVEGVFGSCYKDTYPFMRHPKL